MGGWRLVADVGGTNVRFARALKDGRLADRAEHATAGVASFADALRGYLATLSEVGACADARIGAAGPVSGGQVRLTNGVWTIRAGEVAQILGGAEVRLFNDLQAAALAIPWLGAGDLGAVVASDEPPDTDGAMLAVNVGTGFGAASLAPVADSWVSHASEAGHMSLGATTSGELALWRALVPPATSVEDVLSGDGIVALYRHLAGPGGAHAHSEDILAAVPADPAARRTAETFTALLARVAGDLVLAAAAWSGVYLFGGVVHGWQAKADLGAFRRHFTAKGQIAARMASVPVHVVRNEAAPLIGLARS